MVFTDHNIVIPIENQKWSLPVVNSSQLKLKENILYRSQLRSALNDLVIETIRFLQKYTVAPAINLIWPNFYQENIHF